MSGYCYMLITADHGYWYVGSTDNPKRRLKGHMTSLRAGKHHCQRLQRVFDRNENGPLEFKILVTCVSKEAAEKARQWRAKNPEQAAANDRKSAEARRSAAARAANSARGARQAHAPGVREAFLERMKRHRATGAVPNSRPVVRVGPDGVEARFQSAAEAARATPGARFQVISRICRGTGKTNAGFGWRFA